MKGSFRHDLRTVGMVMNREIIHFWRAKSTIAMNFLQPLLFLLVLGVGLNPVVDSGGSIDFMVFLFPGLLGMTVVSASVSSAASTVVDRQFGFLRVMMVAPVRRVSVALGKIAGGTLTASLQGALFLLLAPFVGARMDLWTLAQVVLVTVLLAFEMAAFGVFMASYVKRIQSFGFAVQFFLFPMLLLSGAMFPLQGAPPWLAIVAKLNPMAYSFDALRRVMVSGQASGADSGSALATGITVLGRSVSVAQELALTALLSILFVVLASRALSRND
ncbi:MAG: ABC transporter permease [Thermoplasmatota archaeon]